jgi:hypothetical protein
MMPHAATAVVVRDVPVAVPVLPATPELPAAAPVPAASAAVVLAGQHVHDELHVRAGPVALWWRSWRSRNRRGRRGVVVCDDWRWRDYDDERLRAFLGHLDRFVVPVPAEVFRRDRCQQPAAPFTEDEVEVWF